MSLGNVGSKIVVFATPADVIKSIDGDIAKYATTVKGPYDLARQFVGTYSELQGQN